MTIPVSRCGIFCGACYVYRAERDGGDLLRRVAESQDVAEEEVKCNGCLSPVEQRWMNCRSCWVRNCQERRGYESCAICPSFQDESCERYSRLEAMAAKRGEDTRAALEAFNANPSQAVDELYQLWSCPACGARYSWYERRCHQCGTDLKRRDLDADVRGPGSEE
jgi:hypothetical protein